MIWNEGPLLILLPTISYENNCNGTRAHRHGLPGSGSKGGGMNRRMGVIIVVLLSIIIAGCSGQTGPIKQNEPEAKILWAHRYQYVRLEPQERCGHEKVTANAHPATLTPEVLKTALASLRIDYPDEEKSVPVFSKREMETLIDPLTKAFQLATRNEDIALAIEGVHPGAAGYQRTITTARLFLRDGELHLVFGKLHDPIDDYDTPLRMAPTDRRVKPFRPGSRCLRDHEKFPAVLITDHVHFFETEDTVRKNWLVIGISNAHLPKKASGASMTPMAPPLSAETEAPAVEGSNQSAPGGTPVNQAPRDRSMEEKLQILKNLWEKGLITDQEYQDKKGKILDSL
jgi:hypothetical protein